MRLRTRLHPSSARPGAASVYLIVAVPVLLLAIVIALNAGYLVETRTTLQNSADAAALAAALALVDDRTLGGSPGAMPDLIAEATAEAQAYARVNPVLDEPVIIKPNPDNNPDGDIVFGALDRPRDSNFVIFDPVRDAEDLGLINTVRIRARRTQAHGDPAVVVGGPFLSLRPFDVVNIATATIDRDVIGFRPHGRVPIPMVPIALRSDLTALERSSWEFQVERHGGEDRWRFDRESHVAVPDAQGDGLFEMKVVLGARAGQAGRGAGPRRGRRPNGCVLQIGVGDLGGVADQITAGISPQQLEQFGGELVLFKDNKPLIVPGGLVGEGEGELELLQALEQLRREGTPRVWPLFAAFDPESGMPVLTGFVAARVVQVGSSQGGNNEWSFAVQPCAMSTVTAVTDPERRGEGGATPNRYVCKVRLIE
jgi:hypothetical protein